MDTSSKPLLAARRPVPPLALTTSDPTAQSVTNLHRDLRSLFRPVFSTRPSVQHVSENEDGSSFGFRPLFRPGRSTSMKVSGTSNLLHVDSYHSDLTHATASSLSFRRDPRPRVVSATNPSTLRDSGSPAPEPFHEPEAEPVQLEEVEPSRFETTVLDAYLQGLAWL